MNKFAAIAKKETTLSTVMEDRTKIDTDEIVDTFEDGVTVTEVDLITLDDKTYAIGAFKEDNTKFFNGGKVFTNIVKEWVKQYNGDIGLLNHDLAECGGVKLKFRLAKTKKGNNVTLIDVL